MFFSGFGNIFQLLINNAVEPSLHSTTESSVHKTVAILCWFNNMVVAYRGPEGERVEECDGRVSMMWRLYAPAWLSRL